MEETYFLWLYDIVSLGEDYYKLLNTLYSIEYRWSIPNDDNRGYDGIALRNRFIYDNQDLHTFTDAFINKPCNVLEMMVALSLRIETDISDIKAGFWFWQMLVNSNLNGYDDYNFDEDSVIEIVSNILDRHYGKKGKGGLFYVNKLSSIKGHPEDFREIEIWYQMMYWYQENEEYLSNIWYGY